jgi:hypothetical protein
MDLARDVRRRSLSTTSFRLLPKKQVIDVHVCLPRPLLARRAWQIRVNGS